MTLIVRFESYGGTFERVFPKEVFAEHGSQGIIMNPVLIELAARLTAAGPRHMKVLPRYEGCIAESESGRQIRWGIIARDEFTLKFCTYDPVSLERWTLDEVARAVAIIRRYLEESIIVRTWLELA